MRIAYFSETFLPNVDGVVNTLCRLLDHLQARGHDSILFAPAGGPDAYATTPVCGVPGLPLPWYPAIRLVPPWADVRSRLQAFRPDVIHLLNPFSLGLVGLRQARPLGVPIAASFHTDVPGYLARYGFSALERPAWAYLRWLHRHADLNLCPSRATLHQLQQHGFPRLKVWTRGVDPQVFSPEHRSMAVRQHLTGGRPQARLLLYVGRLAAEKRVELLLPVLAALPGVRLALVGDGPARADLEGRFPPDRTVFTGWLRGTALAQVYAAADIFVFPSANETLGNVVLEAMASGLPVVAAGAGGPLDLVQDGVNGFLYPPEDQEASCRLVGRLVDDPAVAERLGRQAREYALTRSWPAVLDGLLEDYRHLLEGPACCPSPPSTLRCGVRRSSRGRSDTQQDHLVV